MNFKQPLLVLVAGLSCLFGLARPAVADIGSCLDVLPGANPSAGMACRTGAGFVFERTRDGWLDTASKLIWHDEIPGDMDPTTHITPDLSQNRAQELCRAKGWSLPSGLPEEDSELATAADHGFLDALAPVTYLRPGCFWTSSPADNDPNTHYGITFGCGEERVDGAYSNIKGARCVSRGSTHVRYPTPPSGACGKIGGFYGQGDNFPGARPEMQIIQNGCNSVTIKDLHPASHLHWLESSRVFTDGRKRRPDWTDRIYIPSTPPLRRHDDYIYRSKWIDSTHLIETHVSNSGGGELPGGRFSVIYHILERGLLDICSVPGEVSDIADLERYIVTNQYTCPMSPYFRI